MQEEYQWAAIPSTSLNIAATLDSGQCFRWITTQEGDRLGVIESSAVRLRPREDGFWWKTYPEPGRWDLLDRYFAVDVDVDLLYCEWWAAEPRIGSSLARNAGLRILRQDAGEAFFSFLCASCNTVGKIRRSVQALAQHYGEPVAELDGHVLHCFPSDSAIARASEAVLRSHLWGYRAPVLIEAARYVAARGPGWLESLRHVPYRAAHHELTQVRGIGDKIADCICLFGLGHDEAMPVDTHLRKIAARLFRPDLADKPLGRAAYWALADAFRERFGAHAGWAQQYLFFDALNHAEEV